MTKLITLIIGLLGIGNTLLAQVTLDVEISPEKPYLMPDGETKLIVESESVYLGRGGRTGTVKVQIGESTLTLVPRTVIHVGECRYEFKEAPEFKFGEFREQDMIFTVVEKCTLKVRSTKEAAPLVELKEIQETIEVETPHGQIHSAIYTIRGEGKHFVTLKLNSAEVSRFHPDPELGARLRMDVVSSFGAKPVTLNYKKTQEVVLGEETITLESSDFVYKERKLKVKISVVPKSDEARVMIDEYAR